MWDGCETGLNDVRPVLEVGRYAPVHSTGTSIFEPLEYLHFFVRTGTSDMLPVFCRFVLPCQIFLPPIKTVGSTTRQRKMLPVKLWFINVYTYHNPKPTLTLMQIQ